VRVLLIRARVGGKIFSWPEDKSGLKPLLPLFEILFATAVPGLQSKEDLDRLRATDANNVDTEPLFLLTSAAWGVVTAGNPATYAGTLLYSVFASRILHNLSLIGGIEPLRTLAYLPCFGATLLISINFT
jgi:uncharacterized MAPEG superfamily protein